MNTIQEILHESRTTFDLKSSENQDHLYSIAEALMDSSTNLDELHTQVKDSVTRLEFRMAYHLMSSLKAMLSIDRPVKVAVVFAMWGEQNRLRPYSAENPHGEDTLRTKVKQLDWITKGTDVTWKLYAVDDGCPHDSGAMAMEIAESIGEQGRVEVLFLEKALPQSEGPLKNLNSANESRKGGAIIYGAQRAMEDGFDAVIYTDADNSVHLGQIGLLLQPYALQNFPVVIGNRKDALSVLVKQENRWGVGIKVLRHMQRMIGRTIFDLGIRDTQAAFILYDKSILKEILKAPSVYDFSFDSDWIAASIVMKAPIHKVAFAFVDSFEESASIVQGPMTTWETLLFGLLESVRKRELDYDEDMASVMQEHVDGVPDLERIINLLPAQLEKASDAQLGDPTVMSPAKLAEWFKEIKG